MGRLKEILLTLLWYARRPQLYRHLAYLLTWRQLHRLSGREHSREEAEAWCAARAVDPETAIRAITGRAAPRSVRDEQPAAFSYAERAVAACPRPMGGPANLDLLYCVAEHLSATKVIETGVAYGWSTMAILLSLGRRRGSRLVSTDRPYPLGGTERYVGTAVPPDLRSHWALIRLPDRQGIPRARQILGTVDFCHYDSDKSYHGRMWGYGQLWDSLMVGGILISDDIGDNVAFRDFAHNVGADPMVVKSGDKYVGILTRT